MAVVAEMTSRKLHLVPILIQSLSKNTTCAGASSSWSVHGSPYHHVRSWEISSAEEHGLHGEQESGSEYGSENNVGSLSGVVVDVHRQVGVCDSRCNETRSLHDVRLGREGEGSEVKKGRLKYT